MPQARNFLLFIDANIYLDLYSPSAVQLTKSIEALTKISANVLVTQQVKFEVMRNKLSVFSTGARNSLKTFSGDHPGPLGLTEGELTDLKQKRGAALGKAEKYVSDQLDKIYSGTDDVSLGLEKIFMYAKDCNDDELNRARLRKERGNPPGKRDDPLGDQISWEQLLSLAQNGQSIWIVTRDKDYLFEKNDENFLNPLLDFELKKVIGNGKIYCFKQLGKALEHLRQNVGADFTFPKKEDIKLLETEELEAAANTTISTSTTSTGNTAALGLGTFFDVRICRFCGANSFVHADVHLTDRPPARTVLICSVCHKAAT